MKRYYIVYQGIVQGVGFRWKLIQIARKKQLTGYVRNCDNGNVECEVQGELVDEFVKETLQNDHFIRIYDYSIREMKLKTEETEFTVRF